MGFTTILPEPDWGTAFPNVDPQEWIEEEDDE
jgi:hypothetical protein